MVYRFADFELNTTERRLARAGEFISLRAKVFDTLCVLVEGHGRLLRKDELIQKLWPDSVVEENNLDHNISKLRRALGEDGTKKFIETVPRQGYRFVAEVTAPVETDTQTKPDQEHAVVPAPPLISQEVRFFTAADGARIAYSVAGKGPVLVKAANWLNHLEFELKSPIWRHWLPILTANNTLVRYDERGNGLSSWNIHDFSFEAWVRDFEQLIDELELEKFSLLGISQGAAVAVSYAAKHPERVDKLILYGSFARGWMNRPIAGEIERRNALLTLVRLGWGKDNPAFRQMWTTLFMPDGLAEHQNWFNELQRVTTSPENAVQLLDAGGRIDVVDLLPKVQSPALVMHCSGDEAVPITEGRLVASRIPGSQFVELPSRNHLVIHTEPAWPIFVRELSQFMGWRL
ncbi:MAG TPA: alpha/beta fold hydrolase [Terriglobales bacterium]|nr:alpha/beta fold hydrolase [Terriglobales bacterium]